MYVDVKPGVINSVDEERGAKQAMPIVVRTRMLLNSRFVSSGFRLITRVNTKHVRCSKNRMGGFWIPGNDDWKCRSSRDQWTWIVPQSPEFPKVAWTVQLEFAPAVRTMQVACKGPRTGGSNGAKTPLAADSTTVGRLGQLLILPGAGFFLGMWLGGFDVCS